MASKTFTERTPAALADEAEDYASDWKHGEALIRDSYFTEYGCAFQEIACNACGASWVDRYKLVAIQDLTGGDATCKTRGGPNDDGEGYDGNCGNCSDKIEGRRA